MAAIDPNAPATTPARKAFVLLTPGPYLANIKWVEKTLSSNKKERLTFTFEIAAGDSKGKTYKEDCYLSSDAIWKAQDLAKAFGITSAFDPDKGEELIKLFVGKQGKIVISAENYTNNKGVETEGRKISAFESMDPVVRQQMDAARQARFGGATTGAPVDTEATF